MTLHDQIVRVLRNSGLDREKADAIIALVVAHATSEEAVERAAEAQFAQLGSMFKWDYVVKHDPAWAERMRVSARATTVAALTGETP